MQLLGSFRSLCLLFVNCLVVACNGSGSSNNAQPQSTSPDSGAPQVRPDVREYIESSLTSIYERQAALQFATSIQGTIDFWDDAVKIKKQALTTFRAMDCMWYVFPTTKNFPYTAKADAVIDELKARTYNTKERSLAHVRSLKHLGGEVWTSTDSKDLYKGCDFSLNGFVPTVLP